MPALVGPCPVIAITAILSLLHHFLLGHLIPFLDGISTYPSFFTLVSLTYSPLGQAWILLPSELA